MGALLHTLVAVAWSVSLPPGSAVSLHSRPTAPDCGRASDQTASNFEKVFKTLDLLVNEKDQRGLAAATALLLPDQDQGRTNCFCIHVFMPEGLPDLESERFHLDVFDVFGGSRADFEDPDGQMLQLTYSNGLLLKTWTLDVPDGMAVDAAELASCRWSFEVEDSDFPVVRLSLRPQFATRDGAPGVSPPSFTGPRPPETSVPPPAQALSSDGAPHQRGPLRVNHWYRLHCEGDDDDDDEVPLTLGG